MSWLDDLLAKIGDGPAQANPNPVPSQQNYPSIANAPVPHALPAPARLPELKPLDLSFRFPDLPPTEYDKDGAMPEPQAAPYQPRPLTGMGDSLKERNGDISYPKMGMGDSLLARSTGDVPAKPSLIPELTETFEAPNELNDLFRKEDAVAQQVAERGVASTPTTEEMDPELAAAQEAAVNRRFGASLSKRAADLGAAIAGVKADPNFLKENIANANRPVEDLMTRRKAADSKLDADMKRFNYAFAKDKDDPNSSSSIFYRDTIKQLTKEAGIELKVPDNMSAAELEKAYPSLVNLINAKEARAAKLEAAADKKETKEETRNDKLKAERFDQETTLRKEVAQVNKETKLSHSKFAYEGLKKLYDQHKWGGPQDIAAVYTFVKLLDPDSAVKEGEIQLTMQGQAALGRYMNIGNKIVAGDILSQQYRKSLLEAVGHLYKDREQEFWYNVGPKLAAAKEHKLNVKNIIQQEAPGVEVPKEYEQQQSAGTTEKTTQTAPAGAVKVTNKKTGSFKYVSEQSAKAIMDADKDGLFEVEK